MQCSTPELNGPPGALGVSAQSHAAEERNCGNRNSKIIFRCWGKSTYYGSATFGKMQTIRSEFVQSAHIHTQNWLKLAIFSSVQLNSSFLIGWFRNLVGLFQKNNKMCERFPNVADPFHRAIGQRLGEKRWSLYIKWCKARKTDVAFFDYCFWETLKDMSTHWIDSSLVYTKKHK